MVVGGAWGECCAPRTDYLYDLFPLHEVDLSGQIGIPGRYDPTHVAGWRPYVMVRPWNAGNYLKNR